MKIKRFTLLSLSVGVLTIGTIVGFTNDRVAKYNERPYSNTGEEGKFAKGSALEFLHSIRANVATGKVSYSEYAKARKQVQKNMMRAKSINMSWEFLGPDNVGGRTRSLIIDKNDPSTLYAGSTSGGIFVSYNGGGAWQSYSDDLENNAIASMVQAADGDIYFTTGPLFDNPLSNEVAKKDIRSIFLGSGLYKLTGNGGVQKLVSPTTGNSVTVDWAMSSKLAADPTDPDVIYAGINNGFRYSHDGGQTWNTATGLNTGFGVEVDDIEVASDGTVMVTFSNPGRLYTSTDKGASFTQITGIPLNAQDSRVEYAIAPSDPNVHYYAVANANGCLRGVYQSTDKGQSFDRIIGPSQDQYDFFSNFLDCYGEYSNALSVYPNDPYKILVGGVTVFRWEQSSTPPADPVGSLVQLGTTIPGTEYSLPPYSHGFYFANDSIAYIISDGGITKSKSIHEVRPIDVTFEAINFGYSTSQYFTMGVGPTGLLIGGTQGNGTNIVGYDFNLGKSAFQVVGSNTFTVDGFDADLSNLDPTIGFASQPYGQVRKITGIGNTLGSSNFGLGNLYLEDPMMVNKCGNSFCGTYYTAARLWESFYDSTSQSQVQFDLKVKRGETVVTGTKVEYYSMTNEIPLYYTTTQDYSGPVRIDSIKVEDGDSVIYPIDTVYTLTATDYVQSVLAVGNIDYDPDFGTTTNIWITRHAIHGNGEAPTDWIGIAGPYDDSTQSVELMNEIITMEFSKDGNHLFVGTARPSGGGDLYRISGINNVYSDADGILTSGVRKTTTTLIASYGVGAVTGIAVDPNNPENVIITLGNYGHNQYVFRSTSAVSAMFPFSFVPIMGTGASALPNAPAYDALIHYQHGDTVLIGNDFGVFSSHNAFSANPADVEWTYENSGLPAVPVYEIRQQTFGYGDSSRGITNTGEVYIATHGRGLYRSGDLVGLDEVFSGDSEKNSFGSSLNIYPNPAVDQTSFSFELPSAQNVNVKVYNIHGKLVRDANFGRLSSGPHSAQIDARELPTGTYIIQLVAGDMVATGKFVIQK